MLAKVIIENGVKKIQALTADTGVGAPVGSYLYLEKKSNPQGYLYCDGSTFDETAYPALYQYLGTNVLPDWRELGAKGAEKNTTLIFDSTETDPSTGQAGMQNHDVFTQGEFKDDQLQEHSHRYFVGGSFGSTAGIAVLSTTSQGEDSIDQTGRHGTVTRGKSRAVFIYIKATSGLTENQQENVLNTINENNSYSTEEHPTGKKWIDGKPIYSKTFYSATGWTNSELVGTITNFDKIISISCISHDGNNNFTNNFSNPPSNEVFTAYINKTQGSIYTIVNNISMVEGYITIEYTKTTD